MPDRAMPMLNRALHDILAVSCAMHDHRTGAEGDEIFAMGALDACLDRAIECILAAQALDACLDRAIECILAAQAQMPEAYGPTGPIVDAEHHDRASRVVEAIKSKSR